MIRKTAKFLARDRSRRLIRPNLDLVGLETAAAGNECRKDEGVSDESAPARNPIDAVMAAREDPVEVVHDLHAAVRFKG